KAALREAAVAQQRAGQIADADDGHRPFTVDAEGAADGGDQLLRRVADAGVTEVAEVGQVFAHLRGRGAQPGPELAAGSLGQAFTLAFFQTPQVQTQPANAGPRESRLVVRHAHDTMNGYPGRSRVRTRPWPPLLRHPKSSRPCRPCRRAPRKAIRAPTAAI